MNNIDKIKAAIERLKAENRNIRCQHNENYCNGYDDAFNDLLPVIDSLLEEKSSEELEEAAEESLEGQGVAELFCGSYEAWQMLEMFKSGSEWQKQRDAELIEIAYNDGITIGKTKQKEQMMKVSKEDALLLERAWLTLDNFGHEELAEWLRQFVYRQK